MKKKILIIHTGGTIGMRRKRDTRGEHVYDTEPEHLREQMAKLPELEAAGMPDYDIHEYDPLLDSSVMSPENWLAIAKDIAASHEKYDGFVVLHGTDTMAYTASALPFMLQGLQKPVILTGSQIPLCEIRNDARENLITSMLVAADYNIPEVCLFFGNRLLRGCRAVKVNADRFDAFESPNFPSLGKAGIHLEIRHDLILPCPAPDTPVHVQKTGESRVAALRLFPGISAEIVRNVLSPPIKGLVLETYGVGNGPANNPELLDALREASERGVVIVNCTQCLRGRVSMGEYATGAALAEAGVISGFDMTAEAALAKMFHLLGRNLTPEISRKKMQTSLRGELTDPVIRK